jgi:hypothetical protein
MAKIDVKGTSVTVISGGADDYISLTDIARYKNSDHTDDLIRNWLRNRNTLEFLGIWEQLNNPGFNPVEFDGIRMQAGLNSFTLTPKRWIEATGAIGISSRAGRYGGTYAHKDIAFEFASWVSVEFKLYLIKEFQRLKETEYQQMGWDIRRNLVCLANLETLNAHFIHQGLAQAERLKLLNQTAIQQMKLLLADAGTRRLEGKRP